ncbi:hypothetical protein C1J01_09055 [Nonomuraea aridisoli]|uniref:Uncharacterized protein n=2 Tax=Nonomuraea aridisoli TaxID=2070368 RepID=A0A2W2EV12_9ACTN|nr:hypothetical protein C1J01_09055 [Nonomuraea aridisoli]
MHPDLAWLRRRIPPDTRISHEVRGEGRVDGVGELPGGLVVYVTWDWPRYNGKGEPVPWREAITLSQIASVS